MRNCRDCVAEAIVLKIEDDIVTKYPTTVGHELNQRAPHILRNMRLRWKALIIAEMNKGNLS
jgi:hypothetical protein